MKRKTSILLRLPLEERAEREYEVSVELVCGKTNKAITEKLVISEAAAKYYEQSPSIAIRR